MSTTLEPALARRVDRVRFELRRRQLTVTAVTRPTPGFVQVDLAGDDLADFQSLSFDDHVKLMLPGTAVGDGKPLMRDYTPRRFDSAARTLTLEFAEHGHGPASAWASQATPGQTVMVGGPRGSMIIAPDHAWHLLAGDASALPAIARRLEELPAGVRAHVLVQVESPADERALPSAAEVTLQWVRRPSEWLQALHALHIDPTLLRAGEAFVWCAGEAQVMAQARAELLEHHQVPREAMRVSAYWKRGVADFHERLTE